MCNKILNKRYKIVRKLGEGGFGETFIAQDTHLPSKPQCVIKKLKTQSTDSFTLETAKRLFDTEAKVLEKLGKHKQIPQLLSYFEENREFYLVQELIVGHELNKELTAGEKKKEQQVIALLIEILEILTFVHDQKVIHRDIKPSNILRRNKDSKLVLIDFGAVKQVSTQRLNSQRFNSQSTVIIRTLGYTAPEQEKGVPQFSSDIYAVGMIAIQALTGRHPKEIDEDIHEIIRNEAQVSPQFAQFLDNMVCSDCARRFYSATDALEALRNLGQPTQLTETATLPPSKCKKISNSNSFGNIQHKSIFIKSLTIAFACAGFFITVYISMLVTIYIRKSNINQYGLEQGNTYHAELKINESNDEN
ncbi:serine/threonine-protein kinase [Mastigocoleus testarum]|uniref:non-specific serine/threonine protein kinase n=1 Tax=Mastigocoleus testarum BC008 TaxID=371196 RepID=A0A0V7ZQ37_9CYAN|nr:serine/threonine-protein kinase [Mastigocoleus testarum]KST66570.1 hypothetical protein BC008_43400 [Mastigocoleus testarum BC008]